MVQLLQRFLHALDYQDAIEELESPTARRLPPSLANSGTIGAVVAALALLATHSGLIAGEAARILSYTVFGAALLWLVLALLALLALGRRREPTTPYTDRYIASVTTRSRVQAAEELDRRLREAAHAND